MASYDHLPAETMLQEEQTYIDNLLKSLRTGSRISAVVSIFLSALVIIGIVIPVYQMIVIAGSPLFFLLIMIVVLMVKISKYKKDLSDPLKIVIHGTVDKRYSVYGKGITTHTIELDGKKYIIHEKFYETVSVHDMMEVHIALHSGLILSFRDTSQNTMQELYDKDIRGSWLSTGR